MTTVNNFRNDFDSNNDKNKPSLDYYPKAANTLTFEQQLQLKVMANTAKGASREQLFELLMDLHCLHYNTHNTYKLLLKDK